MMKLTSKKAWRKRKSSYSEEEFDWYTIFKYALSENLIILEQIEVVQEVVLPGISKLND